MIAEILINIRFSALSAGSAINICVQWKDEHKTTQMEMRYFVEVIVLDIWPEFASENQINFNVMGDGPNSITVVCKYFVGVRVCVCVPLWMNCADLRLYPLECRMWRIHISILVLHVIEEIQYTTFLER